jgi:hypothetical protein
MAQDWNNWDGTNHKWQDTNLPWKNTSLPWNNTSLPWKTNAVAVVGDAPVMEFDTDANSQLLALFADDPF